jgi:hypothetical protein
MASLGSLGTPHQAEVIEEETTFDWFGSTIRLPALAVSELELIDLMESTTTVDQDSPAAIVVIKNMFRQVIHADDFDQFWDLAKSNRQQIADLMQVYQVLLEAATGRPTQQPSDSSPGRLPTSGNSPTPSTPPGLTGRPDLQIIREDGAASRAWLAQQATG